MRADDEAYNDCRDGGEQAGPCDELSSPLTAGYDARPEKNYSDTTYYRAGNRRLS